MFQKRNVPRRPSRRKASRRSGWSSSVVGTHASGGGPARHAAPRRRARSYEGRAAEVNQIHFESRSVDEKARTYQTSGVRAERLMRSRARRTRIWVVVSIVVIAALALTLGSCAFKGSLSSSMAINDDSVTSSLVAPASDTDPYYVLLAGISNEGTDKEAASFVAVMLVDEQNKNISLLNIPGTVSASYEGVALDDPLLRDAPHAVNEGELVKQVSSLIDQDINHYLRITDENFVALVDGLGGLQVTVDKAVDDPTVGTTVLDPGEQTLNGTQALAYVSAKNYTDGVGQRASVQNKVLTALVDQIVSKGGLSAVFGADEIAGKIKTDLGYDELVALASLYPEANVNVATMPGSQSKAGKRLHWSVGSSWSAVRDEFKSGDDMDVSIDTSGVDKGSLTIKVLNGAGTDGYSAQAAKVLESAGYKIKETGNAESFVYDETLVIYRNDDLRAAAEAIVKDLGTGRAVSGSVYYSLDTDIQVVVGKNWTTNV